MVIIHEHLGNYGLLKLHKTAFLCSRKAPAAVILKCYDWAIARREAGDCVISGFHSQLEKDVLHYLLKGKQPVIMVLARGLKKNIEPEFTKPIQEGRLLILTPFSNKVKRITIKTTTERNRLIVELADSITVGHVNEKGSLIQVLNHINKKISKIE